MKSPSLRASLTAWFVGLTMLLIGGFSILLYSRLSQALRDGLDAGLKARAETLLAKCEWDEDIGSAEFKLAPELAESLGSDHAEFGFEAWQWPRHRLLYQAGAKITPPLPPPELALAPGAVRFASLSTFEAPERRRLCTFLGRVPATTADPYEGDEADKPAFDILVRVTESLAPVEAQLARVGWMTVALFGASLLVVLAFGLFLARRFVTPLQDLGRAAAAVHAGEKTSMPKRGRDDEIDRLAEVLERTFSSLEESSSRQARFTSDAAHELRNPISVIRNAADVALRKERSGAEYRELFSDVLVTAVRMGSIVEALLMLARTDAGVVRSTFRDVDLDAIVRDSVAGRAESSGRIRLLNGAAAVVRGDAGLLRVLADNLLANALKYSEGKPVDVTVATFEREQVLFSVRDFGPGVPAESRKRVFERFYRVAAQPDPSGAGLGLAIVAEVARVHSAACELQDAAPGTRVIVRFPAAPANASPAASSSEGVAGSR